MKVFRPNVNRQPSPEKVEQLVSAWKIMLCQRFIELDE
jgi:hypothetical protein